MVAGGVQRCIWKFPPTLAKSAKVGKICSQWSQFPRDFWPTEYTESMEDMLLMLYPVLESLRANGCRWGAEMQRVIPPNVRKSPRWARFAPNGVNSHRISGKQSTQNL